MQCRTSRACRVAKARVVAEEHGGKEKRRREGEETKEDNSLLDLPNGSLVSHSELEILLGDRVPVLKMQTK